MRGTFHAEPCNAAKLLSGSHSLSYAIVPDEDVEAVHGRALNGTSINLA